MPDYIFGPVLSSRLGRSLGIDLLGGRICSFDCLYCESGPTLHKTMERKNYADPGSVLAEFKDWLAENPETEPDHITLGGEGEPCLNLGLGEIIHGVKKLAPHIPVAVLTNSSLLADAQVRKELMQADTLLPSLDTLIQDEFLLLNRPCCGLQIHDIIRGLQLFCNDFSGQVLLEILLVPGINDSLENLEKTALFIKDLQHQRVDLTCMSRPGAHIKQKAPDHKTLQDWRQTLKAAIRSVQVRQKHPVKKRSARPSTILDSIRRRPQTLQQICTALGTAPGETATVLETLAGNGEIQVHDNGKHKFYIIKGN